jgi:hypothetical protein
MADLDDISTETDSIEYDADGNVVTTTEVDGETTTVTYDAADTGAPGTEGAAPLEDLDDGLDADGFGTGLLTEYDMDGNLITDGDDLGKEEETVTADAAGEQDPAQAGAETAADAINRGDKKGLNEFINSLDNDLLKLVVLLLSGMGLLPQFNEMANDENKARITEVQAEEEFLEQELEELEEGAEVDNLEEEIDEEVALDDETVGIEELEELADEDEDLGGATPKEEVEGPENIFNKPVVDLQDGNAPDTDEVEVEEGKGVDIDDDDTPAKPKEAKAGKDDDDLGDDTVEIEAAEEVEPVELTSKDGVSQDGNEFVEFSGDDEKEFDEGGTPGATFVVAAAGVGDEQTVEGASAATDFVSMDALGVSGQGVDTLVAVSSKATNTPVIAAEGQEAQL